MNTVLDTIFSFVVGGIVIVMLLGQTLNLRTSAGSQNLNTSVQTNLTTANDIMENDFRKIGYSVSKPPTDSGIVYARADSLVIKGDFNNTGSFAIIKYSLSRTSRGGMNPRTRILLRDSSGTLRKLNLGISELNFTFYDAAGVQLSGSPISRPSKISSIKVNLKAESLYPSEMTKYDSVYSFASWEKFIKPKNLQ